MDFVSKLENRFEDLKEKFSKDQIILIFAKFEIEQLDEETSMAISLFPKAYENDELLRRLKTLKKQIDEFSEFIDDLIQKQLTTI
ncbi:MAG: hypothetical protein IJW36_02590 [Clostridia bacterium]|nr:hypothetical protein [Clostridia bacterium]